LGNQADEIEELRELLVRVIDQILVTDDPGVV
jgi:hypothetical protein